MLSFKSWLIAAVGSLFFMVSAVSQASAQSMTVSVNPTTYTTAGEVLTFTYNFDSGNSVIDAGSLSVTSTVAGMTVNCAPIAQTTQATTTCTGLHSVTAAQASPGGLVTEGGTFDATALGTILGGSVGFAQAAFQSPQASQTISFTQPANQIFATGLTVNLTATASSGLTVSLATNSPAICTVAGSVATILGVGTCSITASQAGNASFLAAPDVTRTFTISQGAQTITFTNPGAQTFSAGGTVALSATGGGSGNPVTFNSTTAAVCTVAASTVTMVAAGTCSINANQAGDGNFTAATQVNQSFAINQASQTITFVQPPTTSFLPGATVALTATSSAGLPVALASNSPGVCTVAGFTATLVSVGTCSITASHGGDGNFLPAPNVTRTFSASGDAVINRTGRVISNFMGRRADQITANYPDLVNRLIGGVNGTNSPVNFTGSGTLRNNQLAFSTSLRQIVATREANLAKNREGSDNVMTLGNESTAGGPVIGASSLDIWLKGTWAKVESDTRNSDTGFLWAGFDYRVSPSLLFGVMTQFDWVNESDSVNGTVAKGHGWMVGPYMVKRIGPSLLLDGSVAWGQSSNEVSPLGTYTDGFDTTRWLAKGQITGDFTRSNWRFAPHVGVVYFEEKQHSYTDSLGNFIPNQTISLGRVTFGPKVSYARTLEDGSSIGAHLGLKGIWDFDKAEIVNVTSGLAAGSSDSLRGRLEGGLSITMPNGWSLSGHSFYDGIGVGDLEAYGGGIGLKVPLN